VENHLPLVDLKMVAKEQEQTKENLIVVEELIVLLK